MKPQLKFLLYCMGDLIRWNVEHGGMVPDPSLVELAFGPDEKKLKKALAMQLDLPLSREAN